MRKRRVVVFIENHGVVEVLKDDPNVEVLVVDRDTYGCDHQTRLRGVCGDDASLTAMAQGLALHSPEKVADAFEQVYEALQKKGANALAERVRAALFPARTKATTKAAATDPAIIPA